MLSLDAFSLSDLQNCLHVLNEIEVAGISDIRFARERLAQHVHGALLARRQEMLHAKRSQTKPPGPDLVVCPECGAGGGMVRTVVDGEAVETCRLCRWSRYIGAYGQPS